MERILDQLKTFYEGLETKRRRALWAALAGSLLIITGVGFWAGQGSWDDIVITGDVGDINVAAAAIESAGIPLKREGNTLQVPSHQYGRATVAIASVGVVEYEPPPLGSSPQVLEAWQKLQLEQQIATSLSTMDEVDSAKVNLALGTRSNYIVSETVDASASVTLQLKPGVKLASSQVDVIANVVAGSVEGLSPAAITITDTRMRAYLTPEDTETNRVTAQLIEVEQLRNTELETSVRDALGKVLGEPDFTVTVNVDLDHTVMDTETVTYGEPVVRSEALREESIEKEGVGGAPGSPNNTPEGRQMVGGGAQSSDKNIITTNFELPSERTVVGKQPGDIEKLSVSVVVNEAAYEGEDMDAWLATVEKAVQGAVGFDETRGDVVTVSVLPFKPAPVLETSGFTGPGPWGDLIGYAVAALGIILFFVMVVRPLMKSVLLPAGPKSSDKKSDGSPMAPEEADGLADRLRSLVENYEAVDADDLNKLVESESEAAAQVIRIWSRAG